MIAFHFKHQTHFETVLKFICLLFILIGYFAYLSYEYDLATGGIVAALTWSFFVLCTPVADAGFLLDFPIRLLFKFRMVYTEIGVWILAATINISAIIWMPDAYQKTMLTSVFYEILITPYPYWGIIFLCGLGTFLSIYFGDEMMDVVTHDARVKHHKLGFKYKAIAMIAVFAVVFFAYHHLIRQMGISDFL